MIKERNADNDMKNSCLELNFFIYIHLSFIYYISPHLTIIINKNILIILFIFI